MAFWRGDVRLKLRMEFPQIMEASSTTLFKWLTRSCFSPTLFSKWAKKGTIALPDKHGFSQQPVTSLITFGEKIRRWESLESPGVSQSSAYPPGQ